MDQVEPSHEEGEEEHEVFREDDLQPVETTPPTPITSNDMDVIIRGWEMKFEQIHSQTTSGFRVPTISCGPGRAN